MKQFSLQRVASFAVLLSFGSMSPFAYADANHLKIVAPEGHAPIMVMGDHMLACGDYFWGAMRRQIR